MSDEHESILVNLIRDQFETVNRTLKEIKENFNTHAEKDEAYWKKIDQHEAQLKLVKGVAGSGAFAAFAAWVYQLLKH